MHHSLPIGSYGSLSLEDLQDLPLEAAVESVAPPPPLIKAQLPDEEESMDDERMMMNNEEDNTKSGSLASHVPAGYMAELSDGRVRSLLGLPSGQFHRSLPPSRHPQRRGSLPPIKRREGHHEGEGRHRSLSPVEREELSLHSCRYYSLSPEMQYDSNPSLNYYSLSPAGSSSVYLTARESSNFLSATSSALLSNEVSSSTVDQALPPFQERPSSAVDFGHSQSGHASFAPSYHYQRPLSAIDFTHFSQSQSLASSHAHFPPLTSHVHSSTSPLHRSLSPLPSIQAEGGYRKSHSLQGLSAKQQEGQPYTGSNAPLDLSTAFLDFQKRSSMKLLHEKQHK